MEKYDSEVETKSKLQSAALEHEKKAYSRSLKILGECDLAKTLP